MHHRQQFFFEFLIISGLLSRPARSGLDHGERKEKPRRRPTFFPQEAAARWFLPSGLPRPVRGMCAVPRGASRDPPRQRSAGELLPAGLAMRVPPQALPTVNTHLSSLINHSVFPFILFFKIKNLFLSPFFFSPCIY